MTVPLNKRTKSKLEFFYQAEKLNEEIIRFLLRDFGTKSISKDLKSFTYAAKMSEEDKNNYIALCEKYHIDVETSFPRWLMEYYRDYILTILRDLLNNITCANSIYPAGPEIIYFCNLRKQHQTYAIANCFQLLQTFKIIGTLFPTKYSKFIPYINKIENEIKLLKEWKKSTNRFLKIANKTT